MEILSYFFSPIPGAVFNYDKTIIIYCGTLFAAGILMKIILIVLKNNKALQKTLRSTPAEFLWISVIILILTLSRTNSIPYLSMRMLLFISLGLSAFFILKGIYRFLFKYSEYKKVVMPKKKIKKEERYTTKK